MTVTITKSASTAGNPPWIRLNGTIQEVLDELQNQNINSDKRVYWTDDVTNAVAVFSRS